MTFYRLWERLGKKKYTVNTSNQVKISLNVADMKRLCEGHSDWEDITVPVKLKDNIKSKTESSTEKMVLVLDMDAIKGAPGC